MREFDELVDIMRRLRSPGGCPWDREQHHNSLKRYLLEEVYEVVEALDEGDLDKLCGELGDVMLQVVFHAQLAQEEGLFDIATVLGRVNEKLRRRHPHVFGDVRVHNAEEVLDNWEQIKRSEGEHEDRTSILDGVPKALPALMRAEKLQRRAAKVGFDWPEMSGAWNKFEEELGELEQAEAEGDPDRVMGELGDVLFALVNVARFLRVDPEEALRRAISRFEQRFRSIESEAERSGRSLSKMTLDEMDALWEAAKQNSAQGKT